MGDGPSIASAIITIFFMLVTIAVVFPSINAMNEDKHWEPIYVEQEDTFLLGEYINGYDLSKISNGTFLARKITLFGGTADITIPLEDGTMFNLGGRNYTLVDHSTSWIKISWLKSTGGEWVKDE